MTTTLLDLLEDKARHVRTPAGVAWFKKPIGALISGGPDAPKTPSLVDIAAPSYHGQHTAPKRSTDYTKPITRLLEVHPEDSLDHPEYYGGGGDYPEGIAQLRKAVKDPNATVTIYRAVPDKKHGINKGDWVTLDRTYAQQHGVHETDPSKDWPVVSMQVPARDVIADGNDLNEFGYDPVPGMATHIPAGALAKDEKAYGDKHPLRGSGIAWDDPRIPDEVYHVSTNGPAVRDTGHLLAGGAGGLGGDSKDKIVSMTISKDIADDLNLNLKFVAKLAREYPNDLEYDSEAQGVATDNLVAALKKQAQDEGWEFSASGIAAHNRKQYGLKDVLNQYYWARNSATKKPNPLFFSTMDELRAIDPDKVETFAIPKQNLDNGAQLTNFDLGGGSLEEIRSYGDVSLTPKQAEKLHTPTVPKVINPGETPIPKGTVRLYHYTRPENVQSIREHGLQERYARGDGNMGAGNEPSAGMWASTKFPQDVLDNGGGVVEFYATPDQISQRANHPDSVLRGPDRGNLESFQTGYNNVIMNGSVPNSQFITIHEPWHEKYRYMMGDKNPLEEYGYLLDPQYANDPYFEPYRRALEQMKLESRKSMTLLEVLETKVRHVRTAAGAARFGQPIGSVIVPDMPVRAAPSKAKKVPVDPKIMSARNPAPEPPPVRRQVVYEDGINEQNRAQRTATMAFKKKVGALPMSLFDTPQSQRRLWSMPVSPEKAWVFYHAGGAYEEINGILRGNPVRRERFGGSALADQMPAAFDEMGVTTTENIKLYRGLKGDGMVRRPGKDRLEKADWEADLVKGAVYTDQGVTSAAASPQEVIGFLADYGEGETPPGSVFLEVRVMAGQRILGGMTGTSETMLPPGTTFRVLGVNRANLRAYTDDGQIIEHDDIAYIIVKVVQP